MSNEREAPKVRALQVLQADRLTLLTLGTKEYPESRYVASMDASVALGRVAEKAAECLQVLEDMLAANEKSKVYRLTGESVSRIYALQYALERLNSGKVEADHG